MAELASEVRIVVGKCGNCANWRVLNQSGTQGSCSRGVAQEYMGDPEKYHNVTWREFGCTKFEPHAPEDRPILKSEWEKLIAERDSLQVKVSAMKPVVIAARKLTGLYPMPLMQTLSELFDALEKLAEATDGTKL